MAQNSSEFLSRHRNSSAQLISAQNSSAQLRITQEVPQTADAGVPANPARSEYLRIVQTSSEALRTKQNNPEVTLPHNEDLNNKKQKTIEK